jgi:hypothetical protein
MKPVHGFELNQPRGAWRGNLEAPSGASVKTVVAWADDFANGSGRIFLKTAEQAQVRLDAGGHEIVVLATRENDGEGGHTPGKLIDALVAEITGPIVGAKNNGIEVNVGGRLDAHPG